MNDHTYDATTVEARGRIKLTIDRASDKYPFHANVLERMVLRADPSVRTMAVTVHGDDVLLLFAAEFVNAITLNQLLGVLIHEVHHVLFGHILKDPKDYPDEWARIVSEEVTVNEFVREPLPEGVIDLSAFPQLPPMESTDKRYERLCKRRRRAAIGRSRPVQIKGNPPPVPGGGKPGDGSGSASSQSNGPGPNPGKGPPSESESDGDTEVTHMGDGRDKGRLGNLVDDHSVWQEALKDPDRSASAIKAVLKDAAVEAGAAELTKGLLDVLQKFHGIGAGQVLEAVDAGSGATLSWESLLRRYVGQELRRGADLRHPSRRCPNHVGIIPGRRRVSGKPAIMAVIDTSGSISASDLSRISSELGRMARSFSVIVVECDFLIQRTYRYRPIDSVQGRGGTDLQPPFDHAFLRVHRPELIIYFTDGYGPAPQSPPRIPVIWCLTPGGQVPAPWGRVLWMVAPENPVATY